MGNELQENAFEELFSLNNKVKTLADEAFRRTYSRLQSSNHFYYMSTKYISAEQRLKNDSPYSSPYNAYINYMNVLSDFALQVNKTIEEKARG